MSDSLRMKARLVRRISAWACVLLLLAIPCTPFVYRWWYPPQPLAGTHEGWWALLTATLEALSTVGDAIAVMVWMTGLGAAALASVIALIAGSMVGDPLWLRLLCAAPLVVLAGAGVFLFV
jgi:hypothetical protein